MRCSTTIALLFCCAASALAVNQADLDARIRSLTGKLEILQSKPDKRIPPDMLRKAKGIILLDRTKAGFIFAYQGGGGVAMVRRGSSDKWSAPAFMKANEASLGFQVGGQQAFIVILLMNTNATALLNQSSFNFGGEASGTAGNTTAKAEGNISNTEPVEVIYADVAGLYGGAAIKGGSIAPDVDANIAYYGEYMTPNEILFDSKAKPTQASADLAEHIRKFSR